MQVFQESPGDRVGASNQGVRPDTRRPNLRDDPGHTGEDGAEPGTGQARGTLGSRSSLLGAVLQVAADLVSSCKVTRSGMVTLPLG